MPKWTDKPWERQKGESEKAFEAFVTYRDMGEKRTLTAVAEKLQKSGTLIRRWKSTWDWAERVRAYDNELTKSKTTAFDAIADALSLDFDATGIRHYVASEKGKIKLLTRRENIMQWVIEVGQNLSTYTYTRSIEDIKTRIKLVSKEGTTIAERKNSSLESKIGVFQNIDQPDERHWQELRKSSRNWVRIVISEWLLTVVSSWQRRTSRMTSLAA